MATDLLTPILEGGIRNVNFFNGRVLTAEDLQAEQQALRQQRHQLGRALGEGVVGGLDVRPGGPTALVVTPGLALNRQGHLLALPREVTVTVAPGTPVEAPADGRFAACRPETDVPTGTGAYVLALAPAAGRKERAPRVGLGDRGVATTCDSRYVVEGVQFKLLHLDLQSDTLVPPPLRQALRALQGQATLTEAQQSRLRNLLAHLCLGTAEQARFAQDPFATLLGEPPALPYGPLDHLRAPEDDAAAPKRLTDCDVPLALLYWTTDRIAFVDVWSVRRRVHRVLGEGSPSTPYGDRQAAEAEAAFFQFQAQLAELVRPPRLQLLLNQVELRNHFRFLPAAGLVPEQVGTGRGFGYLKLFSGLPFRDPVFVEGRRLPRLFQMAAATPPFDLEERELIWLYRVRENRQAPAAGQPSPQAYLVFASGHLPYQGDAQFDLARWNFSNYAPGVAGNLILGG